MTQKQGPEFKAPPSDQAGPLDILRRLEPSITALVGLSSAIKDESFGPLSDKQHHLLDGIVQQAEDIAVHIAELEKDLKSGAPAVRPVKILIVDDDPTNLEVLTLVLKTDGYEVSIIQAKDAPEAVAKAKEVNPDLVFMDVRMPGEYDGLEAVRRLKESAQFHGVIVVVSAMASTDDQRQAKAAGAEGYLTKPFKRKDLVNLLDRFADRLPQAKLKPLEKREHYS